MAMGAGAASAPEHRLHAGGHGSARCGRDPGELLGDVNDRAGRRARRSQQRPGGPGAPEGAKGGAGIGAVGGGDPRDFCEVLILTVGIHLFLFFLTTARSSSAIRGAQTRTSCVVILLSVAQSADLVELEIIVQSVTGFARRDPGGGLPSRS